MEQLYIVSCTRLYIYTLHPKQENEIIGVFDDLQKAIKAVKRCENENILSDKYTYDFYIQDFKLNTINENLMQ